MFKFIARLVVIVRHRTTGFMPEYNEKNYWFYSDGSYSTLAEELEANRLLKLRCEAEALIAEEKGPDYDPSEQEVRDWMEWID